MGYPKAYRDSLRWLNGFNLSEDDVPPYGCCMMAYYGTDCDPYGPVLRSGVPTWRIDQPNEQMEADQNPAVLFFASEMGIKAGGFGSITRDFPCLGLHDGNHDGLRPGMPCGPVADSWDLKSTGFAFTCMGHDDADERVEQKKDFKNCSPDYSKYDNEHCIWVTNERVDPAAQCYFGNGLTVALPIAAGANFIVTHDESGVGDAPGIEGAPILLTTDDDKAFFPTSDVAPIVKEDEDHYILKSGQGIYDVSFSATLYADQAISRGTPLVVEFGISRKNEDGDYPATPTLALKCMREQDIERDNYGIVFQVTKENVAFSHPVFLKKDDRLYLTNKSSCPIFLTYPQFSIVQRAQQSFRRPKVTTSGGE